MGSMTFPLFTVVNDLEALDVGDCKRDLADLDGNRSCGVAKI